MIPESVVKAFEESSFCPGDAIRGRPETGTAWTTLDIEYHKGSEYDYPSASMYYVSHWNGSITRASRPMMEMPPSDGAFVKAVVEWFQSMTQAQQGPNQ